MDISPLFVLRQRLHAAALAGAGSCIDDARLAQASEGLAPLEAAAPVFRKLGDLVRRLRGPEGEGRAAVLLEALTLADALACTQAAVAVPGEAEPVAPAVAWGGAVEDVPFSVLRQVREHLLRPGDWQSFSFMKSLADTRREWFRDARLRSLLLRLLDAHEKWDVHRQVARWLVEQGRDILPLLRASFDPGVERCMESRYALLEALPPTEENAELLLHLCRTEKDRWLREIVCNLLARTPLPDRWDILRALKERDPRMLLKAMEGLDSPEASALTVDLWEHILPYYEAGPLDWSGYDLFRDTLIGKSGPGIRDIYRRVVALDRIQDTKQAKLDIDVHTKIEYTAEKLRTSILVTRDEGLLELAGELTHDVSPCFAVPWLTGLLVMRSTSAAYDAACELLGPEGFGHGALSANAQKILAEVFFFVSNPHNNARDALTRPFDTRDELMPNLRKGGADADCLAAAVSSPCHMIERYWKFLRPGWQKRVRRPFADALDPHWLDAMLLADPFEAYPYYPAHARRGWVSQDEQRTLADLLFRLADLQDPHIRERLGAFFHEQALRGVERGYRVLLWLRCCGRSDYRGIMTAELCRKGKRHGDPISFENYYKAFRLLGEPLTFAEEGEDCLRRIRDGKIRPLAQTLVRKLEKCIAEARREASRIAGETT